MYLLFNSFCFSFQSGSRSRIKSNKGGHSCSRLGKALFPVYSGAMRHDCLANTRAVVKEDASSEEEAKFALRIELRARTDIEEGDEITMQHLSSILGTHKRRRRIMSDYYLDCVCQVLLIISMSMTA